MNVNPQTLRCQADTDTARLIDQAAKHLATIRGYLGPHLDNPAVRLHILASLNQQVRADVLNAACQAREYGYDSEQLFTILTPNTSPT